MAILSSFPSTRWDITLNMAREGGLSAGDITIAGNTVTAVTGANLMWTLTLGTATPSLDPMAFTISGTEVMTTDNAEIAPFMEQIRNLLGIRIRSSDLPDSTIRELAFLRKAEMAVLAMSRYDTDMDYDVAAARDTSLRDRFRLAVMYRTAALLVPALPDIVRESFQDELRQFVQMDWEQKINFFLTQADDALIEEDLTPSAVIGRVGSVGSSYTRYVAY